jgi:alanine racemase
MSAVLRVDLDAFAANLAHVRQRVQPSTLMLVVKDDAYGHGLAPIARRAWEEGVEWFGAFDVPTGAAVRAELGPAARVFAFIAASDRDVAAAVTADLDLGVGDAAMLEQVATAARAAGVTARVHLKIDTGLHRNGVRPEEWAAFVERAARLSDEGALQVVGIWSHISEASDEDDDVARTAFDKAVAQARDAGLTPEILHLAASAASFARPEFRYDMVRVGAFCYGIRPAGGPSEDDLGVTPIATLVAPVTDVGATATIAAGSLDGLPSLLAGRVTLGTPAGARRLLSMDAASAMLEPWPGATPGDQVAVYGPGGSGESSATTLAEQIGTIGEEIVVRLSPLIPREYRADSVRTR